MNLQPDFPHKSVYYALLIFFSFGGKTYFKAFLSFTETYKNLYHITNTLLDYKHHL